MRNFLTLLFLALLFSPSFMLMKIGLGGFTPLTLATCRVGIASLAVWGYLRATGHALPRSAALWKRFAFMGVFGNAIPFALFCLGETRADSAPAAILNSATPIFTVLLAHLFIGDEPLTPGRLAGVSVGFLGIVTLFLPSLRGTALNGEAVWGYAAFTGAAFCYGISNVFGRRFLRDVPARVSSTGQLLCATAALLPAAMIFERPFALRPGAGPTAAVLTLALPGTALAMTMYYSLLRRTSATFVSMVTYILPPIGIVLGVMLLGERVGSHHLIGCGLILCGVLMARMRGGKSKGAARDTPRSDGTQAPE